MLINMQVISDELKNDIVEARCAYSFEMHLVRMHRLEDVGEDDDRERTVYLGTEEDLLALDDETRRAISSLILIGPTPLGKLDLAPDADVIRLFPNRDIAAVRKRVLTLFESLSLWHEAMLEAILRNADLDELIAIGTQPIENPIGLFSSTGRCITWAGSFPEGELDGIWKGVIEEQVGFSPKVASICVRDERASTEQVSFFRSTSRDLPRQAVTVSIFRTDRRGRKQRVGTLGGTQVWSAFSCGQISLLVDFANRLGQNETITNYLFKRKERDIVYLTEHMLQGQKAPLRLIESALAVAGTPPAGPFVVFAIDLENATVNGERIGNQEALQSTYLSRIVNNTEFSNIALLHQGRLVIVDVGVRLSRAYVEQEHRRLKRLFSNLDFRLGTSDVFTDYRNVTIGFGQAAASLNLGRAMEPQSPHHFFGDYLLEYLFDQAEIQQEPHRYCHSIALTLANYDAQHDTDFLTFMECLYKHGGNKAKAAEELFIHRNTLTYRLNKAKAIAGIDEFDFEDRLFFLTSCRIIRWCRLNRQDMVPSL